MPQLTCYRKDDLPREIAIQIASYVRVQWPAFAGRKTPLWESLYPPIDRWHFVLAEGDVLISHAIAHGRVLPHLGRQWKVWGLSSVFTYPTHRGSGFGQEVVRAASQHVRSQLDADFGLLFCGDRVKRLYRRIGWEEVPGLSVTFGDDKRVFNDGVVLALFVSDRARLHDFDEAPIHVGPNTW